MKITEPATKQVGGLILLLVLAPMIPTTLLLRLMIVTVNAEQAAAHGQAREIYTHALQAARHSLETHGLGDEPNLENVSERVARLIQRQFGNDVTIRVVDRNGQALGGEKVSTRPVLAEVDLEPGLGGGKAELRSVGDAWHEEGIGGQVATYSWAAAVVVMANLAIAGLAGLAVNRKFRLEEMKSSTLATMSHELRTPLTSVRILLDTLLSRPDCPAAQVHDYLNLISKENRRLVALTDHFLAAARLERGLFQFDRVPVRPLEIIHGAMEASQCRVESGAPTIHVEASAGLPFIEVDRAAMIMALSNLLDNAVKYRGESREISLEAGVRNSDVVLKVIDHGIGIAPEERGKIFDRFYQVDQKLSRKHEGCGLGLSISRSIVRAHGGKIEVESTPGGGSTFSIVLRSTGQHPIPAEESNA